MKREIMMKKVKMLVAILLTMAGLTHAAAPVDETIWLYCVSTDSFVTVDAGDGYRIEAKDISMIGTAEQFVIEDAGNGTIRFKAVINDNYIRVNTGDVDKLYADTANATDPLTHFIWTDLADGKVRLTSAGDTDGNANVSPGGSQQVLRANSSSTGPDTEFLWGDPGVDTSAPLPNPAAFSIPPLAISHDSIIMTAAIGSDVSGPVEYYFDETSGNLGGSDRDWDTSPDYTDTGLEPNTTYSYTVQMRDSLGNVGNPTNPPVSATTASVAIHDADLDGSGFVDTQDLAILSSQWMDPSCTSIANIDDECGVGVSDLLEFSSKWLSQQPNIVMLFIDDWAWNGSTIAMDPCVPASAFPLLQMPNLESMAASGMKFQNAYAGAPQCAPSRVCLQTGMTTARTGYTVFLGNSDYYDTRDRYANLPVVPNGSDGSIDPGTTTIPEALKRHGYVSAHFGKWHMGGDPSEEGYIAHDGNTSNKPGNQNIPGDPKLMFSITERAIDFMEQQVAAQKPFYVQISHYAMHEGRDCLPETRAKYQNLPEVVAYNGGETDPSLIDYRSDPAVWLGMGEDMDGRIGAVLQKLEDLGIAENTYVIVAGDNGYRHSHYDELSGLGQPLHAAKWWVWQGGLRIPMIVTGPDIPAGSVCTANVVHYDFLPTFVEWAGGDPISELPGIDGVSIAGLMRSETPSTDFLNRYLYFHFPHYRSGMPSSAIISGNDKLMYFYGTSDFMPSGFDPKMLFDLSSDIGEYTNITPGNPARAQKLHDEMFQYFTEVGARMPLDPNPDYAPSVYKNLDNYDEYLLWGPFEGTRPAEEDEE